MSNCQVNQIFEEKRREEKLRDGKLAPSHDFTICPRFQVRPSQAQSINKPSSFRMFELDGFRSQLLLSLPLRTRQVERSVVGELGVQQTLGTGLRRSSVILQA